MAIEQASHLSILSIHPRTVDNLIRIGAKAQSEPNHGYPQLLL